MEKLREGSEREAGKGCWGGESPVTRHQHVDGAAHISSLRDSHSIPAELPHFTAPTEEAWTLECLSKVTHMSGIAETRIGSFESLLGFSFVFFPIVSLQRIRIHSRDYHVSLRIAVIAP